MICSKCGLERGDAFQPRYRQCNVCREEGQRKRDHERPYLRYWIRLKSLYRLTKEAFGKLWESQNGRCAVCLMTLAKPDIDHCHRCDEVRGLLCHRCNVLCGHLEANGTTRIQQALDYLAKHKHV